MKKLNRKWIKVIVCAVLAIAFGIFIAVEDASSANKGSTLDYIMATVGFYGFFSLIAFVVPYLWKRGFGIITAAFTTLLTTLLIISVPITIMNCLESEMAKGVFFLSFGLVFIAIDAFRAIRHGK